MSRNVLVSATGHVLVVFVLLASATAGIARGDADPRSTIDSLRCESDYEAALVVAEEWLAALEADPEAADYERSTAIQLVETARACTELRHDVQTELAEVDCLDQEIEVAYAAADYVAVVETAERQLAVRKRYLGDRHFTVAETMNNLAAGLTAVGRLQEAIQAYQNATAIFRETLGPRHPATAEALNNLSQTYRLMGMLPEAEAAARESLVMRRELLGPDHYEVAMSLNMLGAALLYAGEYVEAELVFREALALLERTGRVDDVLYGACVMHLVFVITSQGDPWSALPLQKQVVDIMRASFGESHPYVGTALISLSTVQQETGRCAEGVETGREAVRILEQTPGFDESLSTALGNLASNLACTGDLVEAEAAARRSLEVAEGAVENRQARIGYSAYRLGVTLCQAGKYEEARIQFEAAIAGLVAALGADHPDNVFTREQSARVQFALDDPEGALTSLREATRVYEVARNRTGRRTFDLRVAPYPFLAALLAEQREEAAAWEAAERGHARVLLDVLRDSEARLITPEELARERELESMLETSTQAVAALAASAEKDTSATARVARTELRTAEAEWAQWQKELANRYPVTESGVLPLDHVQRALDSRSAIVGWVDFAPIEDRWMCWTYVVPASGPVVWSPIALRNDSPFEDLEPLRGALTSSFTTTEGNRSLGEQLWADRIAPVADMLVDVNQLIVVPSGAMLGIPIETAVDPDGAYLGERFVVSYAPSATVHTWLAEREHVSGRRSSALLVGDPSFAEAPVELVRESTPSGTDDSVSDVLRSAAHDRSALAKLPRLPGTRAEVLSLVSLFDDSTVLLGDEATEKRLFEAVQAPQSRYDVVHVATHGLLNDDRPDQSALVLAQTELPDALESVMAGERIFDGLVTVREILHEWNLAASLVTLSACETGLGRAFPGEGYVGLAHAFLQAGARSVLVGLWKVEDRATALLMHRFYENWIGSGGDSSGKAVALRDAKTWLRELSWEEARSAAEDLDLETESTTRGLGSSRPIAGGRPYSHPYFWAGFVLIGDPS